MLRRVELFHFKNHKSTSIDFSSHFNVVVGRNGSGKSAVIDAIEWCLFHRKSNDLRASSLRDLENASKQSHEVMAVQVCLRQESRYVLPAGGPTYEVIPPI
mmetsp:Transcript_12726/g.20692  ORF Transcript_12726/g.20692 Transcript_12726/m.20692 type:complete len:101 (+) Transcript_12726:1018-1320(+)